MAAVIVTRPALVSAAVLVARAAAEAGAHPKMTIVAEGGVAFTVPYAPNSVSAGGWAPDFEVVSRPGSRPLLLRNGTPLKTLEFDLAFGYRDPQRSIAGELAQLRALAESGARMAVNLDSTTAGRRWRLTDYTEQVVARQRGTNEATRAQGSLRLTEASDPVVAVGPVTGGAVSGPASAAAGPVKLPTKYVFKKGDTIASISKQFYGDAKHADLILDANGLRRAGGIIEGAKLTIPKKK